MRKKNISITLNENLIKLVDTYSKSRHISRSSAIESMLNNVRVIIIQEGSEIVKFLYSLDILLKRVRISYDDKRKIEKVCDGIWQLLDLITKRIQQMEEE